MGPVLTPPQAKVDPVPPPDSYRDFLMFVLKLGAFVLCVLLVKKFWDPVMSWVLTGYWP